MVKNAWLRKFSYSKNTNGCYANLGVFLEVNKDGADVGA